MIMENMNLLMVINMRVFGENDKIIGKGNMNLRMVVGVKKFLMGN